jgi:mitochondrial fission protein ELM1
MISEAASSRNHVIVFTAPGLSSRHQAFLQSCAGKKYIYLAEPDEVSGVIAMIRERQPQTVALPDAQRVSQALESVL